MARRLAIALVCGLAGLAINSLPIAIIAPMLLGRAVTLPVAILFGPVYGALAAMIGAAGLAGTTGSPLLILPLEALVIGSFARLGRSALVGGLLVWTVTALSFVLAPEMFGAGYLRQSVWPVALQTTISRFVAVVIADLVVAAASVKRLAGSSARVQRRRLRVSRVRPRFDSSRAAPGRGRQPVDRSETGSRWRRAVA
jgi:hypothetical protein